MDDAFLRAIRADPEADLPRLVYADWLDEHDDPARAEFVRVQCELAKLPDHDAAYAALEDREHELLAEHEAKWLGDGPTPDEWTFRRGFVDELHLDPADPPSSEWLTRQAVTSVTLAWSEGTPAGFVTASGDALERLPRMPGLEGLREIDAAAVSNVLTLGGCLRSLRRWDTPGAKSLLLTGLVELSRLGRLLHSEPVSRTLGRLQAGGLASARGNPNFVENDAISPVDLAKGLRHAPLESLTVDTANISSVKPLLTAGFVGSLRSLDVSDNPLAQDAHRDFVGASSKLKLRQLDVSGTVLCGPTLRNLLAARCCETLTTLVLNDSIELKVSHLIDTSYWQRAEKLFVRRSGVQDSEFARLTANVGPTGLRSLDLGANLLGVDEVRWLCEAQWARPITWLNLAVNSVDSYAVQYLAQPGAFPNLRTLHLGHNNSELTGDADREVNDEAVEALVNSLTLTRLRVLTLTANPVTDYGVELLMHAPHFTLSGLGLSATQITAGCVRTLAKSPRLARLNWLDLSDNASLHSDALLPLVESPYLSPLCDLDISRTGASVAVRDLLRQRLGRRAID